MSRIGFDLDGVLANVDGTMLELVRLAPEADRERLYQSYYRNRRPFMDANRFLGPTDRGEVITARPRRYHKITEAWVGSYVGYWNIYYTEDWQGDPEQDKWQSGLPYDQIIREVAEAKAQIIEHLNIDAYFEDTPALVLELRRLLPNVAIIQFGGRIP